MSIRFEFKLNDFWVGMFWKNTKDQFDVWVCLIPCFPIHITVPKRKRSVLKEAGESCGAIRSVSSSDRSISV